MQNEIKNKIEKHLKTYFRNLDKTHSISRVSPLLFRNIKSFVLRPGKRLRPLLFLIGYLGFAKKAAANLYDTAVSMELLHDFMLVHDDIIDKSSTRRGKPAMHKMMDDYLKRHRGIKFNGQDLAIISADVMYALAMDSFLSIKENAQRKEKALRKFIQAAIYTGMGEFIELLSGAKDITKITRLQIYRIYDYKTACYTFACPLSCGAILGGASQKQVDMLYRYGIYLGRAFQIKDDLLGLCGDEKITGKSALTDLQETKKTLPLWYAYKNSNPPDKLEIRKVLTKALVNQMDLLKIRNIIQDCGALGYAKKQISSLNTKAKAAIRHSEMRTMYKEMLKHYCQELLSL